MDATMIAVPSDVKDIFDAFWNAQYHGYLWPSETIAVIFVQGIGINVLYNNWRDHAEQKLIKYIKEIWTDIPPLCLNVYMNYSPCHECAEHILNFLQDFKNVKINMRVAALYNIRRYSCVFNGHAHEMKDSSRESLLKLLDYGKFTGKLQMGVFNLEIWNQLVQLLKQVSNSTQYSGIGVESEKDTNLVKLYSYLYPCSGQNQLYSRYNRKIEDELMQEDLKDLFP